jgi:hypothetical protein
MGNPATEVPMSVALLIFFIANNNTMLHIAAAMLTSP